MAGVEDPGARTPREQASEALVARIERAFSGVSPDGRVSLTEAYRADYYGGAPDIDWDDHDVEWTRVPDEVLGFFAGNTSVFIFGNAASFRYYLPAYMRLGLRTRETTPAVQALRAAKPEARETLDEEQRAVVVEFLRFMIEYEHPCPDAERALERGWHDGNRGQPVAVAGISPG